MTVSQVVRSILVCDGCKATHGAPEGFNSAVEARAAAYAAGWRFPPRVRATGAVSAQTNDVCPSCIGEWMPKRAHDSWANRERRQR